MGGSPRKEKKMTISDDELRIAREMVKAARFGSGTNDFGKIISGEVDYYGVDKTVAVDYIASLIEHVNYVRQAGLKIGVPGRQLACHDDSKWTQAEFPGYAMHFKGGGAPDAFASAWLHHLHHNPHHWQHWIFSDNFTPEGSEVENGVVKMPEHYALEMVADWLGSSMAYTGSWDMKVWLLQNMPRIRVHSNTAVFLRETLDHLGYADVVYTWKFAQELDVT